MSQIYRDEDRTSGRDQFKRIKTESHGSLHLSVAGENFPMQAAAPAKTFRLIVQLRVKAGGSSFVPFAHFVRTRRKWTRYAFFSASALLFAAIRDIEVFLEDAVSGEIENFDLF